MPGLLPDGLTVRLLLTIDLPTIATLANSLSFEIRHLQFSRFPCATTCRSFGISGAGFSTQLWITTRLPRRNETFLNMLTLHGFLPCPSFRRETACDEGDYREEDNSSGHGSLLPESSRTLMRST